MMTTAELSSCTTKIFNPTAFPVPTPFCWSYAYAYPPTALFDSRGPCYQSDGGCRVTTFNTLKEEYNVFSFLILGSAWDYFNIFTFIPLSIFN